MTIPRYSQDEIQMIEDAEGQWVDVDDHFCEIGYLLDIIGRYEALIDRFVLHEGGIARRDAGLLQADPELLEMQCARSERRGW